MRAGIVAVLLLLLCAACGSAPAEPAASASGLDRLAVKPAGSMTGYSRAQFGPAWADVDHNGCDTRNDVLNRDLKNKDWRPGTHGCVVVDGKLHDPYTGRTIVFQKAHADQVQIDHVVALADAWRSGAASWTAERRKAFANDPHNLLAVDGHENQSKGDGSASEYLPPDATFRCSYIQGQITVKSEYQLSVTPAEHDAMAKVLATCRGS
jgi:hypothetical protein